MYCPNCKVKLSSDINRCPLCGEKITIDDTKNKVYSSNVEYFPKHIGLVSFSKTIIFLLTMASLVTIICNLAINHKLTWSLIVVFSSLYISTHHLYLTMPNKILAFIINVINLELLLLIIAYISNGYHWYLCLVMPFILISAIYVVIYYYLYRKRNILRNISYKIFYISISLVVINGLIKTFMNGSFYITWSIYASIPLLIISVLMFILSFNKRISTEVEKRLFI